MPLYEYNCSGCKKHLEVIQKFSDAPLTVCPECGASLEKKLSLTSFQLKGTGWYNTDYRKPSSSSASGSQSDGSATGTTSASEAPSKTSKD